MRTIFIYSLILMFISSCGNQLREGINTEAEDVSYSTRIHFLLSGAIRDIGKNYTENGINHGEGLCDWFSPTMGYTQLLQGGERGNNYQFFTNPPSNWDDYTSRLQMTDSGLLFAKTENRPAYEAAFNILRVFTFSFITDCHGDIPYSQAMSGRKGIFFPAYDSQADIYADFFTKIDEAVSILSSTADEFNIPSADLMFNGDKDKWIRFANSLKLRLLVRAHDALQNAGGNPNDEIQKLITSGKLMTELTHNASFVYAGGNTDATWKSGPLRGGGDRDREFNKRKPSSTFVGALKRLHDPRFTRWIAPALFPVSKTATENYTKTYTDPYGKVYSINVTAWSKLTQEQKDGIEKDSDLIPYEYGELSYMGSPIGRTNGSFLTGLYANTDPMGGFDNKRMSNFGDIFKDNTNEYLKVVFMEADEVQFLLAEAAAQGWISGDADAYYKKGIELSCKRWGCSDAEIAAYLSNPDVDINGGLDKLDQIATQKWLALFQHAQEAYFDYRRTRKPAFYAKEIREIGNIVLKFPVRIRYPSYEVSNNTDENKKAVSKLGEDTQDALIWLLK